MTGQHNELEELVGETRTTVEGLRVEAGKVEEFARALSDDDPIYRERDAATDRGFSDVPAPLTFTRTGRFPRYGTDESLDLGSHPEYVLHGAHAYEYERPLVVGDVLRGETALTEISEREGDRGGVMTVAEVETAYYDRADERVVTERATVIETDGAVSEPTEDQAAESGADNPNLDDGVSSDDPTVLATTAPEPARAGDLDAVDSAPEVVLGPLHRRDFVRYAGASGDFNPIHYDEPYARAAGNPSVFGQGMFTAGVAAHAVADWFGLGNVRTFTVRFRSRVWPGDTITATAAVTDVDRVDGSDCPGDEGAERVEADLRVTRDDGETVLTGHAAAILGE